MRTINRSAVVVVPKQPFLDWLHSVDLTSGELTLADARRDTGIYLLPEYDLEPELEAYLEEVCEGIFEEQLNSWCRAEELWPEDRNFSIFRQWFECRFHSMLFDLAETQSSRTRAGVFRLRYQRGAELAGGIVEIGETRSGPHDPSMQPLCAFR